MSGYEKEEVKDMKQKRTKEQKSDSGTKEMFFVNGKTVIPEEDLLLCDVHDDSAELEFTFSATYERLYATSNKVFYKIAKKIKRTDITEVTQEEAKQFINNNVAYVKTDNYIAVFGKPERG